MKTTLTLILGLCLYCHSGSYDIDTFQTERVVPQHSNYVKPLQGDLLEAEDSCEIEDGEILLRRKFGKQDYAIFRGRMKQTGMDELYKMTLPEDMKFEEVVKKKFYQREKDDYWKDIQEVYFNSSGDLFVINRAALFFVRDNKWIKIESRQATRQDLEKQTGELTSVNVASEEFTGEYEKDVSVAFIFTVAPSRVRDYYDRRKKAVVLEFHDVKLGRRSLENVHEYPIRRSEIIDFQEGRRNMVKAYLYVDQKFRYRVEQLYGSVVLKYSWKSKNISPMFENVRRMFEF
ncbi:hypothetical protein ACFL5V_09070 [Fibrobacterota bacterium]